MIQDWNITCLSDVLKLPAQWNICLGLQKQRGAEAKRFLWNSGAVEWHTAAVHIGNWNCVAALSLICYLSASFSPNWGFTCHSNEKGTNVKTNRGTCDRNRAAFWVRPENQKIWITIFQILETQFMKFNLFNSGSEFVRWSVQGSMSRNKPKS